MIGIRLIDSNEFLDMFNDSVVDLELNSPLLCR